VTNHQKTIPTIARVVVFGPNDPVAAENGGDLMFNTYWLDNAFPTWTTPGAWSQDGDLYFIMLSAMGAALGLIDPDSVPRLPQGTNNQDNTIYGLRPSTSGAIAGDYMLYDVHALQWLYNPDPDLRSDDTLYNFDFFGRKTDILRSVVDAGGVDTISAAGMDASLLDLGPGTFSSLGGLTAASSEVRFSIPLEDTLIENLIGSNFDDTLNGNFLANKIEGGSGRDTMTGKLGNDLMMGAAGNDLYIYRLGDGFDTINENAGAGRDTLRVDSAGTLDSFSQDFSFRREGNDLIVDLRLDKADYVEGSIRIVNQKWGSWGVEIFRFGPLGGTIQNIDLTSVYAQSTSVSQNFKVLSTTSAYGFLVAPV
jgi:Ca2+-binding RTX toxin-like protein